MRRERRPRGHRARRARDTALRRWSPRLRDRRAPPRRDSRRCGGEPRGRSHRHDRTGSPPRASPLASSLRDQPIRRRRSPSAPSRHRDGYHRTVGSPRLVLLVSGDEKVDGGGVLQAAGEQRGGSVGSNPPESIPVVVVVVDQHHHPGVGFDVHDALQPVGSFWFVIDDRHDRVTVEAEDDGHEMRAARPDRGQASHSLRCEEPAAGISVHAGKVLPTRTPGDRWRTPQPSPHGRSVDGDSALRGSGLWILEFSPTPRRSMPKRRRRDPSNRCGNSRPAGCPGVRRCERRSNRAAPE